MNISIPTSTAILMVTLALMNTVIPIIIAYHYKKRFDVKISTFFIGLFTYVAFAMLLVQIPDILIRGSIKPFANLVKDNALVGALYFPIITVLMEEFGRLFTFKFMMKNRMNKNEALMMGVGHGGIQSMLTGSSVMMSNAILAFAINSFGAEEYVTKLGLKGEELETTRKGLIEFGQIPVMQHFFDGSIPILIMIGQVALSFIVFVAISDQRKKFLFPVAMLMHFVLLLPLYLVRKEVFTNMFVAETLMLIVLVAIVYFAYQMYHGIAKNA